MPLVGSREKRHKDFFLLYYSLESPILYNFAQIEF